MSLPYTNRGLKFQHYYRCQQPHINPLAPNVRYTCHVTRHLAYTSHTSDGYVMAFLQQLSFKLGSPAHYIRNLIPVPKG